MLHVKPFRQTPGFCGPASLKIVLGYFGVKKSEKELVKLTQCTKQSGVEAKAIIKAAEKLGFKAKFKDYSTFADIKKYVVGKKIPVIVDWFSVDEGHYSVVVGIDKENIYLMDPQIGAQQAMKLDTFKRVWFDFPTKYIHHKSDLTVRRMIIIYLSKQENM